MDYYRHQGTYVETLFAARALALGFSVCWPRGEYDPYDLALWNGRRLRTVQVKSANVRPPHHRAAGYEITMGKSFRLAPLDFLVVYFLQEDVWYIIPKKLLGGRIWIYLNPKPNRYRSRWERFREAWPLLGPAPHPIRPGKPSRF